MKKTIVILALAVFVAVVASTIESEAKVTGSGALSHTVSATFAESSSDAKKVSEEEIPEETVPETEPAPEEMVEEIIPSETTPVPEEVEEAVPETVETVPEKAVDVVVEDEVEEDVSVTYLSSSTSSSRHVIGVGGPGEETLQEATETFVDAVLSEDILVDVEDDETETPHAYDPTVVVIAVAMCVCLAAAAFVVARAAKRN